MRIITELAWQHHFAKNMFIRPESEAEVADFAPDFTVINACKVVNEDYKVMRNAMIVVLGNDVTHRELSYCLFAFAM